MQQLPQLITIFLITILFNYNISAFSVSSRKDASDVHFLLWTRENPDNHQEIFAGDSSSLEASNFQNGVPTKVYAHGWNGQPAEGLILKIKDEYLLKEECNFISVDWSALQGVNYIAVALENVPIAGNATAALIDFLIDQGASISDFHVMGFSLGAQVAGYTGSAVTRGTVPRVTGLDPAWPFFSLNDTDSRLDSTDADFVDVIHTDSGTLIEGGLSFLPPVGHVDFYPNGGRSQPGCFVETREDLDGIPRECNHSRAVAYFAESINSPVGFRAVKCESFEDFQAGLCDTNQEAWMGEPVSRLAEGVFYLYTNDASPFALG